MKKDTYDFAVSAAPVTTAGSDIESSHSAHTIDIEFQNTSEQQPPYHLYEYYKKIRNSQLEEASMNYIKRIRNLREDSDKTQQEIAEILGTSQTMYARYERGANEMPVRHLITLAKYYNVSLDYLCGLTNKKLPFPIH